MRLCGYCSGRDVTNDRCVHGYLQGITAPCSDVAPYAMFRFHNEVLILTLRQWEEALDTKCSCEDCVCCRAKEYAVDIVCSKIFWDEKEVLNS